MDKMDIFIAFSDEMEAIPVLGTAKKWDNLHGFARPSVIQVPPEGFQIKRRVIADNLAQSDYYLLVDQLCVPGELILPSASIIDYLKGAISERPNINIFGFDDSALSFLPCKIAGGVIGCQKGCEYCDYRRKYGVVDGIPTGVRLIRKGCVDKWPPQRTDNYDVEHYEAAGGDNKCIIASITFSRLSDS